MSNTIAETILQQLGSGRFVAMTGAKDMIALQNGLCFTVGTGAVCNGRKVHKVRITLNALDLYHVEAFSVRRLSVKQMAKYGTSYALTVVEERDNVPVENLRECFTALTGFYTNL